MASLFQSPGVPLGTGSGGAGQGLPSEHGSGQASGQASSPATLEDARDAASPSIDAAAAVEPPLPLGLPVADLVGLRFSVVHFRLAGYALIGVWLNEIAGLLTSPLLRAIGTRLHYISQALDVSPLLLVGIALVSFQSGLQRSRVERLLLPILFGLLPLLSALHLLMAPASIANAMTLSAKQSEVSRSQLRAIESQLDRADQVLLSSQDLADLKQRLDAIPGVRLHPTGDLRLEQARLDLSKTLQNERRRARLSIGANTAQTRSQFFRRALQNSGLAILIGLMLGWMRYGAMREMNLSSTYLAWVIVSDNRAPNLRGLKELLEFQRACLATSYLGLLERILSRQSTDRAEEAETPERMPDLPLLPLPEAPWEGGVERIRLRSEHYRRRAGIFGGKMPAQSLLPEDQPDHDQVLSQPEPSASQKRRAERDRRRAMQALKNFSSTVSDSYAGYSFDPQSRLRQPTARQLRKSREALQRFAEQLQQQQNDLEPSERHGLADHPAADHEAESRTHPSWPKPEQMQPNPLGRLVYWFVSHF